MREITKKSVNAFMNNVNFRESNTEIKAGKQFTQMFLFGNLIATRYRNGNLFITSAGWRSNTTKERLNGIPGVSIKQKNGVWYLNKKKWNGTEIKIN